MAAIVTSDEDEDWFTNSRGWSIILERAMRDVEPGRHEEFEKYTNPIGIDFTFIDESNRRDVARWLLGAVQALCGPEGDQHGWAGERSRSHLQELATMLRRMADG